MTKPEVGASGELITGTSPTMDTEYQNMVDMVSEVDTEETMEPQTATEMIGGGQGGFQRNPQPPHTGPPHQGYGQNYQGMSYPAIPPAQANTQNSYQPQTFPQNQIPRVITQPVYQLAVPQPGTVPQGGQGGQGGQGVQDKAKALLENLLAQYNQ